MGIEIGPAAVEKSLVVLVDLEVWCRGGETFYNVIIKSKSFSGPESLEYDL